VSDSQPVLRIALPSPGGDRPPGCGRSGRLRLPAAEWLIGRGKRAPRPCSSWREWLLDDADLGPDLLKRFPAGPCVSAAWTGERARGTWACAAPVHLATAIDHLQLAAPAPLPLAAEESSEFVTSLNAHLDGSGFRLHALPGRGWLCECPPGLACTGVEPAAAVGRNLRELLPAGRDAPRVRALVNELQMLLHEHPVNERRALLGAPAMNSLWLWGFRAAVEPSPARGSWSPMTIGLPDYGGCMAGRLRRRIGSANSCASTVLRCAWASRRPAGMKTCASIGRHWTGRSWFRPGRH
jgi:hypothetical protein